MMCISPGFSSPNPIIEYPIKASGFKVRLESNQAISLSAKVVKTYAPEYISAFLSKMFQTLRIVLKKFVE